MTPNPPSDAPALRHRLVDDLVSGGHLRSEHWSRAFRTEPRGNYVDRFATATPTDDDQWFDLGEPDHHDAAIAAVYSDTSLITQCDINGTAVSSSSQPSLMALMLEHLDVDPTTRPRVLEIGAGTGYNAGLLCSALGDEQVVTVDVDPEIVERAERALHRAGHHPRVLTGDGRDGCPREAPFDRILVTCGFDRVPESWLGQLAPNGVVVVNLGLCLARLSALASGAVSGPLVGSASFMVRRPTPDVVEPMTRELFAVTRTTGERSRDVAASLKGIDDRGFQALRSLVLPTVRQVGPFPIDGSYRWVDTATGAWSRLSPTASGRFDLAESGASVYDAVARLHTDWRSHGRPTINRYGLTVRPDGTHLLWLDSDDMIVRGL